MFGNNNHQVKRPHSEDWSDLFRPVGPQASKTIIQKEYVPVNHTVRITETGEIGDVDYWAKVAVDTRNMLSGTQDISIERRLVAEGLRAVIREMMTELRKVNPNSPLLNKEYRQKLFNQFERQAAVNLVSELNTESKDVLSKKLKDANETVKENNRIIKNIQNSQNKSTRRRSHEHTTDLD